MTTIVAFTSLVVAGLQPVIDFGWMMTTGIVIGFCTVFTLVPALDGDHPRRASCDLAAHRRAFHPKIRADGAAAWGSLSVQ